MGSTGVWDLYQWTAIRPDGRLPSPVDTKHWIWGEGRPADVMEFEGARVVLLGPPSYLRTWSTTRFFAGLKASVVVERAFSTEEARAWMSRLAQSVRAT